MSVSTYRGLMPYDPELAARSTAALAATTEAELVRDILAALSEVRARWHVYRASTEYPGGGDPSRAVAADRERAVAGALAAVGGLAVDAWPTQSGLSSRCWAPTGRKAGRMSGPWPPAWQGRRDYGAAIPQLRRPSQSDRQCRSSRSDRLSRSDLHATRPGARANRSPRQQGASIRSSRFRISRYGESGRARGSRWTPLLPGAASPCSPGSALQCSPFRLPCWLARSRSSVF
jgi:hypothetical protein